MSMDTIEWLADPAVAFREMARVTDGALIFVQMVLHSRCFDSDDPDTSQEFSRLFAGPHTISMNERLDQGIGKIGLAARTHDIHTVRGKGIEAETYARYLLNQMREWLVIQRGIVRARRFDSWRKALDTRTEDGAFAFSLDRHVVVVDCAAV